jgi:hypothetical protein
MDAGLTGLEQYSWERAGYFIRRSAIDANVISAAFKLCDGSAEELPEEGERPGTECVEACGAIAADTVIQTIAGDLLQHPHLISTFLCRAPGSPSEWGRGAPVDLSLPPPEQAAILHALPTELLVRVALGVDHTMFVLPGSHWAPVSPDQAAEMSSDPHCKLIGAVRIRLDPGDALFLGSGVLRRVDPQPGAQAHALNLHFVRRVG